MLNEIKYSNLKDLANLSVFELMSKHPIETVRVLFRFIEDKDLKINSKSKKKAVSDIRLRLSDSLSKENPWLSSNNDVDFSLSIGGNDVSFRFSFKKRDKVRVEIMNFLVTGITKDYDLLDKANKMFGEIASIVEDMHDSGKKINSSSNYKLRQSESDKIHNKYGDIGIDVRMLDKYANRYLLRLGNDRDEREMRLFIIAYFPGAQENLAKILEDRSYGSVKFKYSFQIERLKRFVLFLDKKLKNRGILIQDFFVNEDSARISLSEESPDKIKTGENTYGDYNKEALRRVENIDMSRFEDMSFKGFKKMVVSKLFKDE